MMILLSDCEGLVKKIIASVEYFNNNDINDVVNEINDFIDYIQFRLYIGDGFRYNV